MINNPDIQPSAAINHWISAILLFDFRLRHILGKEHGPDRLLRRPRAQQDPEIDDDYEEWIDLANVFTLPQSEPTSQSGLPLWMETLNTFAVEILNDLIPFMNTAQTVQVSSSIHQNESSHDMPAPYPIIPQSDKAKAYDRELDHVRCFLEDPQQPPDMPDEVFKHLI